MPLYSVRNTETGETRLVDAPKPASALKHVVTPLFKVELAQPLDVHRLAKDGVEIETVDGDDDNVPLINAVQEQSEEQRDQALIDD